jgi:tetratricopeptide (TPR) repeat protein
VKKNIFLIILLLSNTLTFAQKLDSLFKSKKEIQIDLLVHGKVKEAGMPLVDVKVVLLSGGFINDTVLTNSLGEFSTRLQLGFRHKLFFIKEGYVTKSLEVNTLDIPEEDKDQGFEIGGFEVSLFKKIGGVDYSIFDEPVGKIYYNQKSRYFNYDKRHIKETQKKMEAFETELIAKRTELLEIEKENEDRYNVLIRDGDIEFKANDLEMAKDYYLEAVKLKPEEDYPKIQLDKIMIILDSRIEKEAKYNQCIEKADMAFKEKKYDVAKVNYYSALQVKKGDEYATAKLAEIKKTLENAATARKQEKVYKLDNIMIPKEQEAYSYELAQKYPQGVTEEISTEGNKTITKRIIVDGNKGVEYKMVTHSWGGTYYFRNDSSIPEYTWQKETSNF